MRLVGTGPVAVRTPPPDGGLDGGGIVAHRRDRLDEWASYIVSRVQFTQSSQRRFER